MRFAWNRKKAATNLTMHGVPFEEACTALADPLAVFGIDPDHPHGETRWIVFGMSQGRRVLVVVHTEESDTIRIISARPATRRERKIYEEA